MTAPRETYRGWACTCNESPEKRDQLRTAKLPAGATGTVDSILWMLNIIAGPVEVAVDQWWGVACEGEYGKLNEDGDPLGGGTPFRTYIQADELDMALIETWEQWAARYASVNEGRRPWSPWDNPR